MKANNKKRRISLLLIYLMLFSLVGCGSSNEVKQNTDNIEETKSELEVEASTQEFISEEGAHEEDFEVSNSEEDVVVPPLRDSYDDTNCKIGCAVTYSELQDEKVWDIITTHFSAVTFGNELKPDALFGYSNETCPGKEMDEVDGLEIEVPKISFARVETMLDKFLEWNKDNPDKPIRIRGHVLVWHSQTPEWFFHEEYNKYKDYVDKETMDRRQEWYIKTVLTHFVGEDSKYKDLFYGWDVVNEAVSDNGGNLRSDMENPSEKLSQNTHGSNSSWWHIYQSDEYIINAFKYANKYAPSELELYYNDYNESDAIKMNGIVSLLEHIKASEGAPGEGTRITAMGMQGHYGMDNPNVSAVQRAIETYADIVGDVQFTELDIKASDGYDGSEEARIDENEKLRKRYNVLKYAMDSAVSQGGANITCINFWGTVDQYSWLQNRSDVGGGSSKSNPQCPLLFDDNYEPKPCFWVFVKQ